MKFTDQLQALDDSDLTVYESRYFLHIWRRGSCWEPIYKIAKLCKMSKSQGYRAHESLIKKGWIVQAIEGGRVVLKVADTIPGAKQSNVASFPGREQCNIVEVPDRELDFPGRELNFPGRDVLPINRTKEVNQLNSNGVAPVLMTEEQLATQRAIDATLELSSFWQQLTEQERPDNEAVFRRDWFKPFNRIWILSGRDVDAAKSRIQAVRDSMIGRGMTLLKPATLLKHVKTQVDADLLPMTELFSGNGRSDTSIADTIWQRAMNCIKANRPPEDDPRLLAAIRVVGWPTLQTAND